MSNIRIKVPGATEIGKPAEQTMWYPQEVKLKDGKGIMELDIDVLEAKFGSHIKRLIIQKVFKENNRFRIGLVINGPDVILEEHQNADKTKSRG